MLLRRIARQAFLLAVLLTLVVAPSRSAAAPASWAISRSPGAISAGTAKAITVVISDLGGPSGSDALGCVEIRIPGSFEVKSAAITSTPKGTTWSTSTTGSTTVTVHAANGSDRLDPAAPNRTVRADIVVVAASAGHFDWIADAFASQACSNGFNAPISFTINVKSKAAATPLPTPTSKPEPTPTSTPRPTPKPAESPTPTPTPTQTPPPTPTPTPRPTPARPTPSPDGTDHPAPTRTAESTPPAGGIVAGPRPGSSGPATVMPGIGIDMPGVDGAVIRSSTAFDGDLALAFGSDFQWMVPGLILTFPGALIVLVVVLQLVGALAWLPIARRRLVAREPLRRPTRPRPPRRA